MADWKCPHQSSSFTNLHFYVRFWPTIWEHCPIKKHLLHLPLPVDIQSHPSIHPIRIIAPLCYIHLRWHLSFFRDDRFRVHQRLWDCNLFCYFGKSQKPFRNWQKYIKAGVCFRLQSPLPDFLICKFLLVPADDPILHRELSRDP